MTSSPPPVLDPSALPGLTPGPVLVDARWYLDGRSGHAAYLQGHLPGAVFLDLDRWLSDPEAVGGGRNPLPAPETFTEGLARAGIGDEDHVVAYDDAGGLAASRLVWLMRATGRPASLLDGGLGAWDGPLDTDEVERPRAAPQVRPWPEDRLADIDEAARAAADDAAVLLDARATTRYRGEEEPVDPRPGHVPGALSLPAARLLDADRRMLPAAELVRAFSEVGVDDGSDVVASCGSGVTACLTLLALEQAGLGEGRLWPGSYSQWSRDPDRAVVTGDEPR